MAILLTVDANKGIAAKYTGSDAELMRDLFGSDVIPTAFTFRNVANVEHHAATVISKIRSLNPDKEVSWDFDSIHAQFPLGMGKA